MRTVTPRENAILERIMRRIDRKLAFEAMPRQDGNIDLRLTLNRLSTLMQLSPTALEASAEDAMQFETLRGKVKRVFDRMRVPPPEPKAPRVEIQKDLAFGPRMGHRGGRR
jgi:hypothetical protein